MRDQTEDVKPWRWLGEGRRVSGVDECEIGAFSLDESNPFIVLGPISAYRGFSFNGSVSKDCKGGLEPRGGCFTGGYFFSRNEGTRLATSDRFSSLSACLDFFKHQQHIKIKITTWKGNLWTVGILSAYENSSEYSADGGHPDEEVLLLSGPTPRLFSLVPLEPVVLGMVPVDHYST